MTCGAKRGTVLGACAAHGVPAWAGWAEQQAVQCSKLAAGRQTFRSRHGARAVVSGAAGQARSVLRGRCPARSRRAVTWRSAPGEGRGGRGHEEVSGHSKVLLIFFGATTFKCCELMMLGIAILANTVIDANHAVESEHRI